MELVQLLGADTAPAVGLRRMVRFGDNNLGKCAVKAWARPEMRQGRFPSSPGDTRARTSCSVWPAVLTT